MEPPGESTGESLAPLVYPIGGPAPQPIAHAREMGAEPSPQPSPSGRGSPEACMEIGCHLPIHGPLASRDALLTFCRAAEERNVESLWTSDHVVFPRTETGEHPGGPFPFPPEMAYLEAVTVLAAVASVTERARIGCSVFILGHRHPVVMAKMLSSIDVLSNGRLICGIGGGWGGGGLSLLGGPDRPGGGGEGGWAWGGVPPGRGAPGAEEMVQF